MKLLDRILFNRLIKIITNFIVAIFKIFVPKNTDIVKPPSKKRPLRDLLDRIFK